MAFYACLSAFPLSFLQRRVTEGIESLKLTLGKEGFVVTIHSFHGVPWIANAIYLIKIGTESGP